MNHGKIWMATLVVLSLGLLVSAASAQTVGIADGSVDNAGDTITVTITADGVTDLANFDITVTYDPAVAIVTDAANDAAFGVAVNNLEKAANGTVRLASLNFGEGQTGDGVLLSTLTLEGVGEGQTALTLSINELKNSSEGAIVVTTDEGTFTVGDPEPSVLAVTADPASVTENIATDVTFNVTCDGSAVDGALVTLLGCGVDANSSTDENGTAAISVTATEAGTINVTATMGDYGDAATTITVTADSRPSGSTVSISNGSADAGATSTVTITADGVTDLANFDITVTYDPAVAIVTDAANDAAFGVAVNNLENAANGTVRLANLNFGDGQTGDGIVLSTLTLESVGTAGQTSALTLTINGLLDSTEAVIDVTPVDGVFTVNGSGTASLAVTVDPTSVTENITTDVTFTVTCDGSAVDGALVTLLGCGVDVNGTTGADGAVILSVTATDIGTIDVTATKDACDDATTGLDVVSDESTPLTILSATLSPNVVLSDGSESTTLTVQASSSIAIASVTVNLSAIGGSDEQALDGTQMEGTGTWTTTFNTTSEGTFDLTVTVTDRDGNSATSDVTLTAGPYKYTLSLKQGWNMVSLPYDITAVGIDTTQKLGDMITDAGVSCYYVAWFNPTSQMMESDLISPPEGMSQDTYPIVGGQAYFVFVEDDTEVAVVGTLW